jgi:tetratricopeptide (TPR) repeat protein
MPGPGIDAELPPESGSQKGRLEGKVRLSGQLTEETSLREVLEQARTMQDMQCGLVRILSKNIRGYIGITNATVITGAHVTSTREYGLTALRKLLAATKGIFVVMEMSDHPIELQQSLKLSIDELVGYRDSAKGDNTSLSDALLYFATKHADYFKINAAAEAAVIQGGDLAEFESYMALGGEAPALQTNLSKLTGGFKKAEAEAKAPVENILNRPVLAEEQPAFDPNSFLPPAPPSQPKVELPPPAPSKEQFKQMQQASPFQEAASAPQTAPAAVQAAPPQQQVFDDLNRAMAAKPTEAIPLHNAPPQTILQQVQDLRQSTSQPLPAYQEQQSKLAGKLTSTGTKVTKNVDDEQRASQRMARQETQSNTQKLRASSVAVQESEPSEVVITPEQRRRHEVMSIASVLTGLLLFVALGHQMFNFASSSGKYGAGVAALKAGDYARAISEMTAVIQMDGRPTAYMYRALAETRIGKTDDAVKDYEHLLEQNAADPVARVGLAAVKLGSGQWDSAITNCDQILKTDPKNLDAYRLKALASAGAGNYEAVIEPASKYLKIDTDMADKARAEMLALRAFAYYKQDKFKNAIGDYSEAIKIDTENAKLFASRGIIHKRMKNWSNAIADLSEAVKLDGSMPSLYRLRGDCYQSSGDIKKASADFNTAVKLRPNVDVIKRRAAARIAAKDYTGALEDLEYLLKLNPNDHEAKAEYDLVRTALVATGKPLPANLDLPVDTGPLVIKGTVPELVQQGYAQLRAGHADTAIEIFTAALKANPNEVMARRYLAYAFNTKGNFKATIQQIGALQRLTPLTVDDKVVLGKAYYRNNNNAEAIQLLSPILGEYPTMDEARMTIANAYINLGRTQEALLLCQDGAVRNPQKAAIYNAMIQVVMKTQERQGVRPGTGLPTLPTAK